MSEPYSLVVELPIAPGALREALDRPTRPAAAFSDWGALGFDPEPVHFERAAVTGGWPARRYLGELRGWAREEPGWTFRYDAQEERLFCISLLWAENLGEMMGGLAILRSLGEAARRDAARPGYILVHDYVFGSRGSACALILGDGAWELLPGDAPHVAPLVEAAAPAVRSLLEMADRAFEGGPMLDPDSPPVDDFLHWE
jgi:hypothetical protein